jgi:putative hydrolase of the HAD superfamily
MNIKHIFFDLDHTLWDFETNSDKTFEFILKKNNIQVNIDEFKEIYRPINHRYWKLFREDKVSKSDLRYSRLKDTFDELNYQTDDSLINLLAEEYIIYLSQFNALFEGAIDILQYLCSKYELHIITNGFEEVQYKKLRNSSLLPFFNKIVTSEKVGVKKPNPKIFQYALDISSAKSDESIMIGDNFEADILGARNVGMHTIFCKFNGEIETEEVLSVSKLIHIKRFL